VSRLSRQWLSIVLGFVMALELAALLYLWQENRDLSGRLTNALSAALGDLNQHLNSAESQLDAASANPGDPRPLLFGSWFTLLEAAQQLQDIATGEMLPDPKYESELQQMSRALFKAQSELQYAGLEQEGLLSKEWIARLQQIRELVLTVGDGCCKAGVRFNEQATTRAGRTAHSYFYSYVSLGTAPDFHFSLYQGEEVLGRKELSLSDLHGKLVVLYFWGIWCHESGCITDLQPFYEEFKDQVALVGIYLGQRSQTEMEELLHERGATYPTGFTNDMVPSSGVLRGAYEAYEVSGDRTIVFINSGGEIWERGSGFRSSWELEELKRVTKAMLQQESASRAQVQ
jgi:hypothetical protein